MNKIIIKIKKFTLNILNRLNQIIKLYIVTEISLYSANAAFFLIVSAIPIFMLLFSTISLIPSIKVEDFIININLLFPNLPYVRETLEYIISIARTLSSTNVISLNLITAIITGSTALYSFSIGIRRIHNITKKSSYIKLRMLAFFNMFIFFMAIFIMLIAFIMGSMILGYVKKYIPFAENIIDRVLGYRYIIAFIVLLVLMLSLYTTSTNFQRNIKHNILGASIATFLWLIISNIFSFYFKTFPLSASVYGSLAGIVVVMLWLYICMNIIFLGSVINEIYYPELKILEEQKEMIMQELSKGHDEKVDKIINESMHSTKIKKERPKY